MEIPDQIRQMQDLASYISPYFVFVDNGDYGIYAVSKSSIVSIWNERFASDFGEAFYSFEDLLEAIDWSDYSKDFIYGNDAAFRILDVQFN